MDIRVKRLVPAFALLAAGCVIAPATTGVVERAGPAMVVSANPLATAAGEKILRAGGSAVDAAVAMQAVLGLVEPQSSGFGGGGFMTYFDAGTGKVSVYDGRETAPGKATSSMFLNADGSKFKFFDAKNSGLSTGVPGMVSLLTLAHADHGRLQWSQLFDDAVKHARFGFAVSLRMNATIKRFRKYIPSKKAEGPIDAWQYLMDETGQPLKAGHILRNSAYAKSMLALAKDPRAIYEGALAESIVAATDLAPRAGRLSLDDMKQYQARRQEALCITYRANKVCGPPPASSWLSVAMILKLLEAGPEFADDGAANVANWSLFVQAQRLAYADRDQFVADDEFVKVPVQGLLSSDYAQLRGQAISLSAPVPEEEIAPGDPWAFDRAAAEHYGDDDSFDAAGTTHFVVVDGAGNVVSLTASVESVFGSTRMAGGMFLNNQLTDFSFKPIDADRQPIANRSGAGKRPRSSMSPTVVLDADGKFLMATGSPGGSSIIAYTAKTLVGVLDWGLSPQQAIDLPNVVARRGKVRVETSRADATLLDGLKALNFNVKESRGENSGLSVVVREKSGSLAGGVDPRREGTIGTISP